jgi:hypothetical protein
MWEKNGIILVILIAYLMLVPVRSDPFDALENEDYNPYLKVAMPRTETVAFGDLFEEIPGHEIAIGTSGGFLAVLDQNLDTILSIDSGSYVKKIVIERISERDRGIFVLTEDSEIKVYSRFGTIQLCLPFDTVSDFIVINADEDTQTEIIVAEKSTIMSFKLSGEKIWSFQSNHDFEKLVELRMLAHFGGFAASTSNEIYFFSQNGSPISSKVIPVSEIRNLIVWQSYVHVLGDLNEVFELKIESNQLKKIYPNESDENYLEFISKIHPTTYGLVAVGQRGKFQLVSGEGEIMVKIDLGAEIVGFDCANLDGVQGAQIPTSNKDISSPEFVVSTQIGRIYIYVPDSNEKEFDFKMRESYQTNTIRYATIFPVEGDNDLYRLLTVETDGKIHSYSVFSDYCNVLIAYNSGLKFYRDGNYHESELSLKGIADPESESPEVIRNRSILRDYGLLSRAEMYLYKSRERLHPLVEQGKSHAETGYRTLDPIKAIENLFSAYQEFQQANIHEDEKVYGGKTLDDLKRDICKRILEFLDTTDAHYQESEYELSLNDLLIIYPKMNVLMETPLEYVEQAGLTEFEDLAEKYKNIEDVKELIILCMNELDKISQNNLDSDDLQDSQRLNDLLTKAANTIGESSEKYESRNKEIARIIRIRKEDRWKKVVYILFWTTTVLIALLIMERKIEAISEKRDYLIFSVSLSVLLTLALIGIQEFLSLSQEEQIENLRFTAGSLIQGYVAVLAIVPGIILALTSFLASRYPPHITKKIWKSRETASFFLAIAFGLAICCFVLISLNDEALELKMGGIVFSVAIVLIAIFLLADHIKEIFDMKKLLSHIQKNIKARKDSRSIFEDLISVIYSLAENRDIENLRAAINDFFDLVIGDDKYFDDLRRILFDILRMYKKGSENFNLNRTKAIIEEVSGKVTDSGIEFLIVSYKKMMDDINTSFKEEDAC